MMASAELPLQEKDARHLARRLRIGLLIGIGGALVLLAVRVARYPAYFAMPGALGYLIEPLIPLGLYAMAALALPWLITRMPAAVPVLRIALLVGLLGGLIEVVSTALESLARLPQSVVSVATLVAMDSLFLLFGAAGFLGSRRTGSIWNGLATAIGSAIVAIMMVVTFGFLLVNLALPTLAHDEIGDPDYQRSGWTDVRAFAIANTLDAGFLHLVEAPIIATILGLVGSSLGRIGVHRHETETATEPSSPPERSSA